MKMSLCCSAGFCLALLFGIIPTRMAAQGQPTALVIEGGTLIDGNGGAPLRDSVVVIQGNKIAAISRKGQMPYPPNAQVIKADGKFVVPGLWDFQVNYAWFWGELFLSQGVTSTVDIGNGEEVSIAHRDAVTHGKITGPRTFIGIGHIGGFPPSQLTGLESALSTRQAPKSAEDARAIAKRYLAAGADMVMFHDGTYPVEYLKAAFEEAHKAGKPAFLRASGPAVFPKDGALAGADVMPHSAGVGEAIAKDGSKAVNELDRYADMDDAKANDLIQVLVQHKVSMVPTIINFAPTYPKDWARFEAESRRVFSDPGLLAYYQDDFLRNMLATYQRREEGTVRERRMKGYQNMLRFNKMYDQAGGHVVVGANTNSSKAPGMNLHEEMEVFAEAGISPMHIIQGSTKWAAGAMRVQDKIGTVEAGKLADLVIVNADPLQDVTNLRKIDSVIWDGKVVDRSFHPWYSTPFGGAADDVAVVENLPWTVSLKKATFQGGEGGAATTAPDPVASPQPAIETIFPVMVTQGSPTTTLTLKGFNFVRRTRVYFDGVSVPYKRVSPTELQVTIDGNFLQRAGRFNIIVKNPETDGKRAMGRRRLQYGASAGEC